MSAFTVNFELQKLISKCNSSVTRMTPCLEKAYDNLFGSEYNQMVICFTENCNILIPKEY